MSIQLPLGGRGRPTMVFLAASLAMGLLAAGPAGAQIELQTQLDHRIYLQFEPVVARTTVRSRIGQPVVFNAGKEGPVFYYEVRNDYGHVLALLPEVTPPHPHMIASQGSVVFTNFMNQLFPMNKPGYYSIQPCVDWMGKTYRGEKRHLEIVTGREITRIAGMVPADQTTRTYMIFHINRGQQDHIILRIDDEAAGLCYGVYSLGRSVMNERPELAMDMSGQAHILFQSAPRTYTHMVFSPFGVRVDAEVFGQAYSRISLQSRPNGTIEAVGQRAEPTGPAMIDSILDRR